MFPALEEIRSRQRQKSVLKQENKKKKQTKKQTERGRERICMASGVQSRDHRPKVEAAQYKAMKGPYLESEQGDSDIVACPQGNKLCLSARVTCLDLLPQ